MTTYLDVWWLVSDGAHDFETLATRLEASKDDVLHAVAILRGAQILGFRREEASGVVRIEVCPDATSASGLRFLAERAGVDLDEPVARAGR